MICDHYKQALMELAARGADPDLQLLAHLQTCSSCRSAFESERSLFASIDSYLRTSANADIPSSFIPTVRAQLQRDCGITSDGNRFHVHLVFERSALYPDSVAQTEKSQVSRPDVPPLVRQFKASVNIILRDGQTSETVSTDPLNGHSLRVSTTINVIK